MTEPNYLLLLEKDAVSLKNAVRSASGQADICLDGMRAVNEAIAKGRSESDCLKCMVAAGYSLDRAKSLLDARPRGYTEMEIDRAKFLSAKYRRLLRTL